MPRSYSIGEFADELGVHPQTVKPGVATTISTTPEHPAVNVEFHTENSAGSQATLAPQAVLDSTPASQVTARKKTATSTANSTDSQNTLTTTDGASKTQY